VDFKLSRLGKPEWFGMASGLLLVLSLFMPWFMTDPSNEFSVIKGSRCGPFHEGGSCNAFQSFDFLEWALILLSLAPFVHAWIAARDHEVSWLRGELTAILGFLALMLVLLNAFILGQPGTVEITPSWGVAVAIVACIGILLSGSIRQYSYQQPEPPGV
jgi:hypothetical protein